MQQGYGHLAAISSVAGIRGLAPAPAYSASKAYQIHYFGSVAATCTHFPQEGLRDGCSSRIRSYSLAFPSRKIVLGG